MVLGNREPPSEHMRLPIQERYFQQLGKCGTLKSALQMRDFILGDQKDHVKSHERLNAQIEKMMLREVGVEQD
eukprot:780310-Pyramimonas_sp.AAC.1